MSDAIAERRAERDRRSFGWQTVVHGFVRSRRHVHRRGEDEDIHFIDWHHPWLFFLAVGTMLLSCADAVLTLILLENGMVEANPFMAGAMQMSTVAFITSKMALTGIGILALVFLAKAHFLNRIRTGLFLTLMFTLYACLVCYELVSLFRVL